MTKQIDRKGWLGLAIFVSSIAIIAAVTTALALVSLLEPLS